MTASNEIGQSDGRNSPPLKKRLRFVWVLAGILGVVIIVGLGYVVFGKSLLADRASVSLQLVPNEIAPGQTFQLEGRFRFTWADEFRSSESDAVFIRNAAGDNLLLEREDVLRPSTTAPRNQELAADVPGFVFGEAPKLLVQPSTGPTIFSIEDITGCSLGLAAPSGPPPFQSIGKQAVTVLAATPPGQYTVIIKPGAYCDGLPTVEQQLPLTVR